LDFFALARECYAEIIEAVCHLVFCAGPFTK